MNNLNYASFEASRRLYDAGIWLDTEAVWVFKGAWKLERKGMTNTALGIPAPSMAEVWRELPETIDEYDLTCEKIFNGGMQAGYTTYDVSGLRWKVLLNAANPTDALIDLLIWVRKEAPDGLAAENR